jgi:hypothetical protein
VTGVSRDESAVSQIKTSSSSGIRNDLNVIPPVAAMRRPGTGQQTRFMVPAGFVLVGTTVRQYFHLA